MDKLKPLDENAFPSPTESPFIRERDVPKIKEEPVKEEETPLYEIYGRWFLDNVKTELQKSIHNNLHGSFDTIGLDKRTYLEVIKLLYVEAVTDFNTSTDRNIWIG